MIMILAKEKPDKTFAFAYLKIMKEDGSIVHDGSHELYVYKVWGCLNSPSLDPSLLFYMSLYA